MTTTGGREAPVFLGGPLLCSTGLPLHIEAGHHARRASTAGQPSCCPDRRLGSGCAVFERLSFSFSHTTPLSIECARMAGGDSTAHVQFSSKR